MNLKQHINRITVILSIMLLALPMTAQEHFTLPKHKSDHWTTLVMSGGVLRKNSYYMRFDGGYGTFTQFNFVDGFSAGPKMSFGKIFKDYSRFEISENIKWAVSRKALNSELTLRYLFNPQYFGFVELFGANTTVDYNRYSVIDENQRSLLASLFAWNHPKLYLQRTFGATFYGPLGNDFQLNTLIAWERREQVENTCWRSIFGTRPNDNTPFVRGVPMEDYGVDKILRVDVQLDYIPGRRIFVKDDMTADMDSNKPTISLRATTGWNEGLRYMSLDLSVFGRTKGWTSKQQIMYRGSIGFFPVRNKVLLMDMRHFNSSDASGFSLQRGFVLNLFTLLDSYELSTYKNWIEAHAEWNNPLFYAQAHFVKVPSRAAHEEISGGITLNKTLRLGCAIGFDDLKYDGISGMLYYNF